MLTVSLLVQTAEAQQFGGIYSPRALCVTDPYGTHFASWQGPPMAFNSYYYLPFGGQYSSGYSGTSTGYFGGGIPAVSSATTPEWVIQKTSVFPLDPYSAWTYSRGVRMTPFVERDGLSRNSPP